MTAYANVDGETVIEATLVVPNVGPWHCELTFEGAPDLSGAVTLSIGALQLSGTISPVDDGTFGEQRKSRIVAGAGGWGSVLSAQHYHNDGGVRAQSIAEDVARLVGETIGDFEPATTNVGIDYVRQAGLASRALEDVIGGVPWHVGYDGRTNVGERATSEADVEAYEVLDSNPREGLVVFACDDLTRVGIGSVLSERLDAPVTVFDLEVRVEVDSLRCTAWGGAQAAQRARIERGRLAGLIRGIARRANDDRLFGRYRYRVVQMSGNRVELQAVAAAAGLPDILPIAQKPGVSGAHASLTGGSIVLVEFVEGDRTLPIVTAYAGKDEEGHAPDTLDLSVVSTLRLGSDAASESFILGDAFASEFNTYLSALNTECAALQTKLTAEGVFVTAIGVAVPALAGAAGTYGSAIGAFATAVGTFQTAIAALQAKLAPAPAGVLSVKVKGE